MDFMKALGIMEKGGTVKRPLWKGYLFLDIDDNVKHAGDTSEHEILWKLDLHHEDWEEYSMVNKKMDEEISTARMEALMDQNSSHLKRLYYLEDMIEDHHKSVKRLVDSMNNEMDDTRKALSSMSKLIPNIKESMASMKDMMKSLATNYHGIKSQHLDNKELIKRINKLIKELHLEEEQLLVEDENIKEDNKEDVIDGEEQIKPKKPKRKPSYRLPKSKKE